MTDSRLIGHRTLQRPRESLYASRKERTASRWSLTPRSGSVQRGLAIFVIALQILCSLFVAFVAAMSVTGDWL